MDINICFGINNSFCQHCGVTIASILANSSSKDKYHIHIISDYLSEENIRALKSLKYIKPFELTIHIISVEDFAHLNINERLGMSTFFRWKALELIKSDKVLYLDSDIIVRKDIRELYQTDVTDFFCAGAEDIIAPVKIEELGMAKTSKYINAGVMLINLEYARKHNTVLKIKEFIANPWDRVFDDQEILNYILQGEIKYIDITWNCMVNFINHYDQNYYNKVCKDPAVVHFITHRKPWLPDMSPAFKSEYFMYLQMTPWFKFFMLAYQIEEQTLIFKKLEELNSRIAKLEKAN